MCGIIKISVPCLRHLFANYGKQVSKYVFTSSLSMSCSDLHFLLFCLLDQLIITGVDLSIPSGTSINFWSGQLILFH